MVRGGGGVLEGLEAAHCGGAWTEIPASKVRLMLRQERGTSSKPARVYIHDGDKIVAVVQAKVELKPGSDGGFYPCVTLEFMEAVLE